MEDQTADPILTDLRAVEDELTLIFRRARSMNGIVARQVHPELESDAYGLLAWVSRTGATRLTDISAQLGMSKGTLSRQVHTLESLGLIRRTRIATDARAWRIEVTEDGQARIGRCRAARTQLFYKLLEQWPRADVRRFAELLHQFNDTGDWAHLVKSCPGQPSVCTVHEENAHPA